MRLSSVLAGLAGLVLFFLAPAALYAGSPAETPTDGRVSGATSIVVSLVAADSSYDRASVDLVPTSPGRQTRIQVPTEGTYAVDNQGNLTFTPLPNFRGRVTVPYLVVQKGNPVAQLVVTTIDVTPLP